MSDAPRGRFARLREAIWQGHQLSQLRQREPLTAAQLRAIDEAEGCLEIAWRVLSGLEPVAASARSAVAAPLLAAGLAKTVPIVAPELTHPSALFDDAGWQERLKSAGLDAAQQATVAEWFREPAAASFSFDVARLALVAARAVLGAAQASRRAVRRLLWRRVLLLGSVAIVLLLSGIITAVVLAARRPADLAARKPWHASSAYPGFALQGLKPEKPIEGLFFSTNEEPSPWLSVDLQARADISGVDVLNRTDCCGERANPLALELSVDDKNWHEVARQNEAFSRWEPRFAPTKARYVRVRALRPTNLHLKDISVYASKP